MMHRVMTLYDVSLLHYQMTPNSAVHRSLACVIYQQNNSTEYLWTNKVIYISCMINWLLIGFEIKITDYCFNFIGE